MSNPGPISPSNPAASPLSVAGNWRIDDTDFMRAAAALLICNSHLKYFYPFRWLAGDGLLGNSMFFFLSGFGIALSIKSIRLGFFSWYSRRIKRIYPAAALCTVFFYLLLYHRWRDWHPLDYVHAYIWPTPYDYVMLIMVVYIFIYGMLRIRLF